jgi:hypothetical protein
METQKELQIADNLVLSKIYIIRNQKVMLDRDLAELYGVETKALKQAVKRNLRRFPSDFMFEMNMGEYKLLRSQIVTSSWGGERYLPMAFTESGVAMLSGILNSERAISVNIAIMRIFTKIRQALTDNTELRLAIEEIRRKTENNTKNIELVFQYLDEFIDKKSNSTKPLPKQRKQIGYKLPAKK